MSSAVWSCPVIQTWWGSTLSCSWWHMVVLRLIGGGVVIGVCWKQERMHGEAWRKWEPRACSSSAPMQPSHASCQMALQGRPSMGYAPWHLTASVGTMLRWGLLTCWWLPSAKDAIGWLSSHDLYRRAMEMRGYVNLSACSHPPRLAPPPTHPTHPAP